jgi:hypothetical protein
VLQVQVLRKLLLEGGTPLSAASGLAVIGDRLHVVADDENSLATFGIGDDTPGRLLQVFDGDLPTAHDQRKAAKPDFEALALLPPIAGHASGALLAVGSGSRDARCRAALLAIDTSGRISARVRVIDLSPIYAPLRQRFPDLNIEGAFVDGGRFCLLQRGHRGAPVNACIVFDWAVMAAWLTGASSAPEPVAIVEHELGMLDGVPLCFTDGAALPGGGWAFCAAAEDTSDSYADGTCLGSVVGVVDSGGVCRLIEPISVRCKAEGIAVTAEAGGLRVLLVTDADDRATPASLLSGLLRWPPA